MITKDEIKAQASELAKEIRELMGASKLERVTIEITKSSVSVVMRDGTPREIVIEAKEVQPTP